MLLLGILLLSSCAIFAQEFVVPEATIEAFHPKGLRVSIPDVSGIKLFAFHAKVNEELNGREGGTFSRDITRAKDGRWTFWDPQARLKVGDVIYYWTYADYFDGERKLGYVNDDREYRITRLIQGNGKNPVDPVTVTPLSTTTPSSKCSSYSKTTVNEKKVCTGQLIFEDQFQTLDPKKWKTEVKISGPPDYQFCIYVSDAENVAVRNNMLELKPTLAVNKYGENFINEQINLGRNCTGVPGTTDCDRKAESFQILPPVLSGRVKSKDLFSFRYGKIEIRAKLPKGNWIYPELFLQPKDHAYGLEYDSGQIRIAFSPGNMDLGNELKGGVILGTSHEARNQGIYQFNTKGGQWSNAFHTYGLLWNEDGISISVDGSTYGFVQPPDNGYAIHATEWKTSAGQRWAEGERFAPFDKEFYMMLGVGVGGHNFVDNVGGKPWKNTSPKSTLSFWKAKDTWYHTWGSDSAMQIDYVKVWAL